MRISKFLILLILVAVFSCKKEKSQLEKNTILENDFIEKSYQTIGKELFKNVNFTNWDTNAKPEYWDINESVQNAEKYVVDRDTLDLLLNGHEKELTYISQNVKIKKHTFYLVEAQIETNLKHNSPSGIFIRSKEGQIMSKIVFENKTKNIYRIIFNSKEEERIIFYLGYKEKEKGQIKIKSLTFKEIELNNNVYKSKIAQYFFDNQKLDFKNEKSFDKSVELIFRHTGELLVAKKRKDTLNLKKIIELKEELDENSYLIKYLKMPVEKTTNSFEEKIVFSGIEILKEFNIGTQRIELNKGKQRSHILLNYYNPFSAKWITIDPFYNSKISNLSKIEETGIDMLNYGGLSRSVEGLIKRHSKVETIIKQEKIISYPF